MKDLAIREFLSNRYIDDSYNIVSRTEFENLSKRLTALEKYVNEEYVPPIISDYEPIKWIGYYGNNKAVLKVPDYELLILEPDNLGLITDEEKSGKKVLGYLAIAEVVSTRWFYNLCKNKDFIVETNNIWGSYRINPASTQWQHILLDIVAPVILEDRNYDGIFFDVCDLGEYLEANYPETCAGAIQGETNIIQSFKEKYPDKIIACNGGYQPIINAYEDITYYIAESTISTWKTVDNKVVYEDTSQASKDWLYPRITTIQNKGIKILDWEYADVDNATKVVEITNEALSHEWNPFITNRSINWFPGINTITPEIVLPPTPPVIDDPDDNPDNWTPATDRIAFTTSAAGTNVNFFENSVSTIPPSKKFKVYINDVATDQNYSSITFNANDKVVIQLLDNNSYYPPFKPGHWDSTQVKNYVKAILEPFPKFEMNGSYDADDFANQFTFCSGLTTLPQSLYKNNPAATTFYYAFAQSGLTTLPLKLFENCTNISTFEACFNSCAALSSIANDVFLYSTGATNLSSCFYNDNELPTFTTKIGSTIVSNATNFVSAHWQSTTSNRIVQVKSGSTTYTTFNNAGLPGLGIQTY